MLPHLTEELIITWHSLSAYSENSSWAQKKEIMEIPVLFKHLIMPMSEQGYYLDIKKQIPDLRFYGNEDKIYGRAFYFGNCRYKLSLGLFQRLQKSVCTCFIIICFAFELALNLLPTLVLKLYLSPLRSSGCSHAPQCLLSNDFILTQ